jgi:FlaA1/EpsC-like NDP-sugar epimerase
LQSYKKNTMKKESTNIFKDKSVLVTGAGGTIGSQICKKLLDKGISRLSCYDISEYSLYRISQEFNDDPRVRYLIGDVRDRERLERSISSADIVVHAAALKHVRFCEFNPDEAYKTNVIGTQNIVDACRKYNVEHGVLISTDKAVNPTSVMGTTKLLAEKLFMNAPERDGKDNTKFTVVRFGNVFGSAGSVIETFHRQICSSESLTLTDEKISRYFISISEACDLVIDCIQISKGKFHTPIFILKMKKAKIKRIAERMYALNPDQNIKAPNFKIIGLNDGEKFEELLYTRHEKEYLREMGKYMVVTREKQPNTFEEDECFMTDLEIDQLILEWFSKNR